MGLTHLTSARCYTSLCKSSHCLFADGEICGASRQLDSSRAELDANASCDQLSHDSRLTCNAAPSETWTHLTPLTQQSWHIHRLMRLRHTAHYYIMLSAGS
eukprot:6211845-Pleurochrysis_carterae.AAC.5